MMYGFVKMPKPLKTQTSFLSYGDLLEYRTVAWSTFDYYTFCLVNNKGVDQPAPLLFDCNKSGISHVSGPNYFHPIIF